MNHRPVIIILLLLTPLCAPAFAAASETARASDTALFMPAIEQPAGLSDTELKQIQGRFLPASVTTTGPLTTTAEIILWDEGHHAGTSLTRLQGAGNTAANILTRQSR